MSGPIAVLGAGSWGTALTLTLQRAGRETRLWARRDDLAAELREGRNERYLPGIELDPFDARTDLNDTLDGSACALLAVPSHALADVCHALADHPMPSVCCAKGLERESGRRLSEVLVSKLTPAHEVSVLLGPSHAEEVALSMPTAIVLAGEKPEQLHPLQELLSTPRLRIYTNEDLAGVEYAAALKNVLAIAAGIADGIGLGDNAKGALLTRGLAEIARLGVSLGGRRETFFGLSGIGDVITTCASKHSRNRAFGERIGRGESVDAAIDAIGQVVEGVETTRTVTHLARRHRIPMPISFQVEEMLFSGKSPREAIEELMLRSLRSESDDEWTRGPT